jgi:putative transposase
MVRGMTVREIQGHLTELYGTEVSPNLISQFTVRRPRRGARMAEPAAGSGLSRGVLRRAAGQDRDEGLVKNKAVYVALAYNSDGEKDVLGLWVEQTEGAKFWLRVVKELKARAVNDILIAAVDGLKGFAEATPPR